MAQQHVTCPTSRTPLIMCSRSVPSVMLTSLIAPSDGLYVSA
jgi:hypothetical protein